MSPCIPYVVVPALLNGAVTGHGQTASQSARLTHTTQSRRT